MFRSGELLLEDTGGTSLAHGLELLNVLTLHEPRKHPSDAALVPFKLLEKTRVALHHVVRRVTTPVEEDHSELTHLEIVST